MSDEYKALYNTDNLLQQRTYKRRILVKIFDLFA